MRVALIDCDINKNELNINKYFKDCIFFDYFQDDIDEAIYCVDIRVYDIIYIKFNPLFYKKYLNIIGTLNRDYDLKYKFFMFVDNNIDNSFISFKEAIRSYKKVEINYIDSISVNKSEFIIENTEFIFKEIPHIKTISINHEEKTLTIKTKDGDVIFPMYKMIDMQVILYFLRHYGEVININSIVSSISSEPEFMSNSPIESSISSIRKLFKTNAGLNPIKAFKRVGYQFKIA